jgi:pimeloyl-ACP methyl ester carboxylesterase
LIRQGSGEPLVLLHGVTCTESIWARVVPHLAPYHDTIVLTAIGHRGGPDATQRPVRVEHWVDDIEGRLKALRINSAHLAGNSMGGWVALELARRGRARSVCALSPAGTWEAGSEHHRRSRATLHRAARDTRRARPVMPALLRVPAARRYALRNAAAHGERTSRSELLAIADDVLGCQARGDLFDTDEELAPLDPPPCPITIAWAAHDRVLPLEVNGARARELVPGARFTVLEDVGHLPMLDDPELVARTILEAAGPRAG